MVVSFVGVWRIPIPFSELSEKPVMTQEVSVSGKTLETVVDELSLRLISSHIQVSGKLARTRIFVGSLLDALCIPLALLGTYIASRLFVRAEAVNLTPARLRVLTVAEILLRPLPTDESANEIEMSQDSLTDPLILPLLRIFNPESSKSLEKLVPP